MGLTKDHKVLPSGVLASDANYFTLGELESLGYITLGRGKVISKEDIKNVPGNFPVYSSSATGAGEIGRYGLYMFEDERITWSIDGGGRLFYRPKHKYSVTNVCGWLKVNTPEISTRYLHLLLTARWERLVFDYTYKAHPSVIRDAYKGLCFPGRAQQDKVTDVFDKLESVVSNRNRQLVQLQQLVKSRFVEMFGDLARNQNQWGIVAFDDVAEIEGGLTTDFEKYSNCPHIGIDSIEKDTGTLKGYRTVSEDKLSSGKYHFTARHIIYSKIRPNLNKVALPAFEGLCSADAYAILPKKNVERIFLAFVLRSRCFLDYIIPLSGRSGMPKANQVQVRGFQFPLPPLALQREFAAFVEKVDKLAFAARRRRDVARQLYRAKIQEFFG